MRPELDARNRLIEFFHVLQERVDQEQKVGWADTVLGNNELPWEKPRQLEAPDKVFGTKPCVRVAPFPDIVFWPADQRVHGRTVERLAELGKYPIPEVAFGFWQAPDDGPAPDPEWLIVGRPDGNASWIAFDYRGRLIVRRAEEITVWHDGIDVRKRTMADPPYQFALPFE